MNTNNGTLYNMQVSFHITVTTQIESYGQQFLSC